MGTTAIEMAESVPTVVISLAFCSSMRGKLDTADSRGEVISERRVDFHRENDEGFYTYFLGGMSPNIWGTSCTGPQLLLLPGDEDARSKDDGTEREVKRESR